MNSNLFSKLGMQNVDPAYFIIALLVICIGLLVMIIVTNGKMKKLAEKYERFMMGKDLESMEDVIMKRFSQIDSMLENTDKNTKDIQSLFENMKLSVQKIGVVKYDAFHEMGGKLSFALVMLDGNNTGFAINAMHSREGCYTYIKEIIGGESYIPLGTEEKQALNQALGIVEE